MALSTHVENVEELIAQLDHLGDETGAPELCIWHSTYDDRGDPTSNELVIYDCKMVDGVIRLDVMDKQ